MIRPSFVVLALGLAVSACSSGGGGGGGGGDDDGTAEPGDGASTSGDGGDSSDGDETGNGGADGGVDGGVARIGTIRVGRTPSTFDSITLGAAFYAYSPALDAFTLPSSYVPDEDACVIVGDGSVPTGTTTAVGLDLTFRFAAGDAVRRQINDRTRADRARQISAGETLVFTSPDGTFGELVLDSSMGYQMPGGSIVGAAPERLEVDIPGDAFPTFTDVEVPVMTHVSYADVSSNTSSTIVTDSRLSWEPDATTDSLVALRGQARNLDASPPLVADVICVLVDDGEFELTAAQRQRVHELLSSDPSRPEAFTAFEFQRVGYRSLRDGDTVLIVQSVAAGERDF